MGNFPPAAVTQLQDPIQRQASLQDLLNRQTQGKLGQAELVNTQQQQKDLAATTTAMKQWDGKDPHDLITGILNHGGSANAVRDGVQHVLDMRNKASEIAKADAMTAASKADTEAKINDEYRGRIQSIVAAPTGQKQSLWDAEVTKEEQAGKIKPGQIPHQYPGDDQATVFANQHALGSVLLKEANEKQQTANSAWKPLNGQLVNTQTGDKIGANFDVDSLNKALETRYQVLNPGKPLPPQFALKPTATPEDFGRVDKLMEATEKAQGTKAQQDTANAIRAQTFELTRDKADLNAVMGTDPKSGRTVLVPFSQAQEMGIKNPMKADADMVNKSQAARHWLQLANGQGDAKGAPEEMGIMQLIDKLDAAGKLGPLAGRWNDFMAGKFGAGDADYAALRAKMGLSTTLLMQAHVGSRGGSALLEHFEDLANAGKMDGATLKAAMGSEINYVQDKAMDPNGMNYRKPSAASGPPPGATHTVLNRADGKKHWTDEKNSKDYGVAE